MITIIKWEEAMISYGKSLLTHGSRFLLEWELWAWKTTITKGIADGIGIDPSNVQSPTYTYMHIYDEKLLHIDMRRIESEQHFFSLGLHELIDAYEYVVIEWPKRENTYIDTTWQRISIQRKEWSRICSRSPWKKQLK
jgi:tRNA threonylcarbamoyladenosine biosynthesis protein TsaE